MKGMWKLALGVALTAILILALPGCSGTTDNGKIGTGDSVAGEGLPDFARQSPEIAEIYQMAAAHPDVLKHMPCYCGCEDEGHTSNLSCFVREMNAEGKVTKWDPMGAG